MITTIFDEMKRIQREMDELFSDILDYKIKDTPLLESRQSSLENKGREMQIMQTPKTDIWETDKEVYLKLDLPGVEKKDIIITPIEGGIEVEAKKSKEKEEKEDKKGYYRFERTTIGYKRIIPLPRTTNNEKAKAKYKDGVLEIVMPKTEEKKDNKRILIE